MLIDYYLNDNLKSNVYALDNMWSSSMCDYDGS